MSTTRASRIEGSTTRSAVTRVVSAFRLRLPHASPPSVLQKGLGGFSFLGVHIIDQNVAFDEALHSLGRRFCIGAYDKLPVPSLRSDGAVALSKW